MKQSTKFSYLAATLSLSALVLTLFLVGWSNDTGEAPKTAPASTESVRAEIPSKPTKPETVQCSIPEVGEPVTEPVETPVASRYAGITMDDAERDLMASVIYLEARGESAEGQQAVAEVILNRVINASYPDTVAEVLWQDGQFSVMENVAYTTAAPEQYDAIEAALYSPILDADVVFFSCGPENERVWGKIGAHYFCREYVWGAGE